MYYKFNQVLLDSKDSQDLQDSKDSQDSRDSKDSQDIQVSKDFRERMEDLEEKHLLINLTTVRQQFQSQLVMDTYI